MACRPRRGCAMSRVYLLVRAQCTQASFPSTPEPGLVEPGDGAGGDLLAGPLQETAEFPGGPRGERGDTPGRQRHAEQLGQRLRGPLLRQELPDIQVDD